MFVKSTRFKQVCQLLLSLIVVSIVMTSRILHPESYSSFLTFNIESKIIIQLCLHLVLKIYIIYTIIYLLRITLQ